MKDVIEWHQAQEMPEHNKRKQEIAIQDFLEEDCEMANGRDLQYWMDQTGKPLEWILENARNIHPVVLESARFNKSFDEVWDYTPDWSDEEDDSDDETSVDWQPDPVSTAIFRSILNR